MLLSCLSSVGMNNTVGLSCLTISSLKIITPNPNVAYRTTTNVNTSTSIRVHFHQTSQHLFNGLSFGHGRGSRWVSQPTYAVKPELDTSVTEMKDIGTTLRKAKVVIESREGDTIQVPKEFLIRAIGEARLIKFVIQEIVSSTMTEYVDEEGLNVKKEFKTIQTPDELESLFEPGNPFGFNATLDVETSEIEATTPSSSEA
ncbi:hypothetical protein AQUCO_00400254v1 [Aquilegia coerulea]|uniref:Trigger factor ribosome-binding bacterial domain-containing protein n=1 Tax=Aquilegia coerulea TaxID=218851 RepID=A0A2G5EU38_AQUCA|nr:hypothetical protein AQUCO_00400254v1 [Aquilegia coerulea]